MDKFEKARRKYKPKEIKLLFIAETPPKLDSDRFFYFEEVDKQDSLFIEIMKFLYPEITKQIDTRTIRLRKKEFLEKFRNDGFYLIDSLDTPFERKYSPSQKRNIIVKGQEQLLSKISELLNEKTKVILIAAPVFHANFDFLKRNGVPILNSEPIDFPGSGGQRKFREKMRKIIE